MASRAPPPADLLAALRLIRVTQDWVFCCSCGFVSAGLELPAVAAAAGWRRRKGDELELVVGELLEFAASVLLVVLLTPLLVQLLLVVVVAVGGVAIFVVIEVWRLDDMDEDAGGATWRRSRSAAELVAGWLPARLKCESCSWAAAMLLPR